MSIILHEYTAVPAWYQLGFDVETMSIQLRLHQNALEYLRSLPWKNISEFISPLVNDWGFGQVLKLMGDKDGWFTYCISLPRLTDHSPKACEYLRNVRRTLQLVFSQLRFYDGIKEGSISQLIVVTGFGIEYGRDESGIGAIVTPPLANWIHGNHGSALPQVKIVMVKVAEYLWPGQRDPFWIQPTYRECNGIGFTVSTNATNCGSGNCNIKGGKGYQIHTHNFDCALDQLILLAGLCCLHNLALAAL